MSEQSKGWKREVGVGVAVGVITPGVLAFFGFVIPPLGKWLLETGDLEAPRWVFAVVLTTSLIATFFLGRHFAPKKAIVVVSGSVPEPETPPSTPWPFNRHEEALIRILWEAGRVMTDEEVAEASGLPDDIVQEILNGLAPVWLRRTYGEDWSSTPYTSKLSAKAIDFVAEKGWATPKRKG